MPALVRKDIDDPDHGTGRRTGSGGALFGHPGSGTSSARAKGQGGFRAVRVVTGDGA